MSAFDPKRTLANVVNHSVEHHCHEPNWQRAEASNNYNFKMARPIGDGNRAIHLHLPRLTSLTPLAIGGVDRLTWVKYAPQEQYVVRSLDPIDLPQSGPVHDPLMNVHGYRRCTSRNGARGLHAGAAESRSVDAATAV
jgi:hypothetical protein